MLTVLPIFLPMLAAALCVTAWGRAKLQAATMVLTTAAMVAVAITLLVTVCNHGVQVSMLGGWTAPFGITFVADRFGSLMVLLASLVGLAVALFSVGATDERRARQGHYPLSLSLLAAVCGAFLSGDLFNLYVWFELMLLSSFVLLTLGGERAQIEGSIKYVTLNLVSSLLFLTTIGFIYATTGTLNMAHLAVRLDELNDPRLATALGAPLFVAFGVKAAVFPVFFWLPASYHTPPPAVAALFAGLLTKVGVYSIIRAATLLFDQEWSLLANATLWIAGLTMVSGVLGAVAQNDMRRILSFHIVSQIGYMLMGLGVALAVIAQQQSDGAVGVAPSEAAIIAMTGSVFYILHHIIVKTNLFLASGAVLAVRGTTELKGLGGIVRTNPLLSGLFLISALSLAGIPVLSGFWSKLVLVRGGLEAASYPIVAVSLVVSILTLFSMMKIWTEGFWRPPPEGLDATGAGLDDQPTGLKRVSIFASIIMLASITVTIGLGAAPAYTFAEETARELLDASIYIDAVFPDGFEEVEAMTSPGGIARPVGEHP